ncbi:MAG: chromate resistance protein [candidate division NC10 bacterium]|nr:chromate resistance protein [candidate division NC10 bacterium]
MTVRYYTRKGIHVDRVASAWLLRRFVDPAATFVFVGEGETVPGAVPFDISGAELGHHRGRCTFEAILRKYRVRDPALRRLGAIIRSADLLASADETLEGPGFDLIFRGLRQASASDHEILERGAVLLDGVYQVLASPRRRRRPTRVRGRRKPKGKRVPRVQKAGPREEGADARGR